MSVTISGSGTISGLTATGISAQPVFAGNVLQVVQGTTSTGMTTTSSTYTDTNLTASITPKSTSSKILAIVSQPVYTKRDGNSADLLGIKLVRNSTDIYSPLIGLEGGFSIGGLSPTTSVNNFIASFAFLDSPSSASSIGYKTQIACRTNTTGAIVGANRSYSGVNQESTLILMEIAG